MQQSQRSRSQSTSTPHPGWDTASPSLDEILEEHNYLIGRHDNDGRRMTLTAKMSPSGVASTTLVQNAGEKGDEGDTAPSIPSPLKATAKSGELAGELELVTTDTTESQRRPLSPGAWAEKLPVNAVSLPLRPNVNTEGTWAPSTEHGRISKIRVTRRRSTVLRQFNTSRQTLSRGNRGVQQQELEFDICAVARVHQKNVRGPTEQTEVTEGVVWGQLPGVSLGTVPVCGGVWAVQFDAFDVVQGCEDGFI
jgi:hypothetical protein